MQNILSKLQALIDPKLPLVTNLSNASALLNEMKDINWCGFYLMYENGLYLGPFQGDVACTFISLDRGVCGYAARNKKTVVVPNVNEFPGHIACSVLSKSEIVVPIIVDNKVKALIDIDSPIYNRFNEEDARYLEAFAKELEVLFK